MKKNNVTLLTLILLLLTLLMGTYIVNNITKKQVEMYRQEMELMYQQQQVEDGIQQAKYIQHQLDNFK